MTETARIVNTQFAILLGFSVAALAAIVAVMVAFVIRYRRSRHPVAVDIRGNPFLELAWIVIPTILVLALSLIHI